MTNLIVSILRCALAMDDDGSCIAARSYDAPRTAALTVNTLGLLGDLLLATE